MNKQVDVWEKFLPIDVKEAMYFVWSQWRKQISTTRHFDLAVLECGNCPSFLCCC
ncbi:hypothetical protein [Nostoc sp. FACHB-892]|uniref:hypothetical protein n=1 Tax=Nostoc sp. FACHB-892 TaxID=2692843 RepID=UPI001684B7B7|nr:hypothetical protein [Nostoc sp. FACHB-892]